MNVFFCRYDNFRIQFIIKPGCSVINASTSCFQLVIIKLCLQKFFISYICVHKCQRRIDCNLSFCQNAVVFCACCCDRNRLFRLYIFRSQLTVIHFYNAAIAACPYKLRICVPRSYRRRKLCCSPRCHCQLCLIQYDRIRHSDLIVENNNLVKLYHFSINTFSLFRNNTKRMLCIFKIFFLKQFLLVHRTVIQCSKFPSLHIIDINIAVHMNGILTGVNLYACSCKNHLIRYINAFCAVMLCPVIEQITVSASCRPCALRFVLDLERLMICCKNSVVNLCISRKFQLNNFCLKCFCINKLYAINASCPCRSFISFS